MVRHTVVTTESGKRLVALRDDAGCCHVARCRSRLPEIERRLVGELPALGSDRPPERGPRGIGLTS
jgi:hypothetical protein